MAALLMLKFLKIKKVAEAETEATGKELIAEKAKKKVLEGTKASAGTKNLMVKKGGAILIEEVKKGFKPPIVNIKIKMCLRAHFLF